MLEKQISLFDIASEYFEEKDINKNNLNNLKFKVHASLIYKLGESLISDETTALSELIKNSYDADASSVTLKIYPDYEEMKEVTEFIDGKAICLTKNVRIGKIEIHDNGCGMGIEEIVNGWLTLSNSYKKRMKRQRQVTPKYKRIPLGDKGLGRLSVQRLGRNMKMVTKKENSTKQYTVQIPWGDFLKNTTIENIPVKCKAEDIFLNKEQGYTTIIITDLINLDFLNKKENIDELERQLSKIISPFSQKDKSSFYVYAKVGNRVLNFSKMLDEFLDSAISKYNFSIKENTITVYGKYKVDFFQLRSIPFDVQEDHIKEFFNAYKHKVDGIGYLENSDFIMEFQHEFDLMAISDLRISNSDKKIMHPGDFSGEIYSYYLDNDYLNSLLLKHKFIMFENSAEYKNFLQKNQGIKVFRDEFAVQGYGDDEGRDWLGLTISAATTGKYIDLKNETVIGYVSLTGEKNYDLKEKTDREGFINDEYFSNFKLILQTIIKRINSNRRKLIDEFREYAKTVVLDTEGNGESPNFTTAINNLKQINEKSNQLAAEIKIINENIDKSSQSIKLIEKTLNSTDIVNDQKDKLHKILQQIQQNAQSSRKALEDTELYLNKARSIEKQLYIIKSDFDILSNQIEDIAGLAGLGMMAETFTHELHNLIKNIRDNTDETLRYINNKYSQDNKIEVYFNYLNYSTDALRKQINRLSPGYKNYRNIREKTRISTLISNHIDFYKDRAGRKKIKFKLVNIQNDFTINVNIGMLNEVFDNLYINAEYWLEHAMELGEINEGEYVIDIRANGLINVWDNGIGVDKSIENNIFEPFVSNKKEGRGLGLYIVSKILKSHRGSIRLLRERNKKYDNLYIFQIDLKNCVAD